MHACMHVTVSARQHGRRYPRLPCVVGANCERFVDIRGFKTLFPLIGSSPPPLPPFSKGKGERIAAQQQFDECISSV